MPDPAREKLIIGWREYVGLPDLGVDRIKVKVDTGARSSAIHAFNLQIFRDGGEPQVRFEIHPIQRKSQPSIECRAPLTDQRWIRNSTGQETLRPVILTPITLMDQRFDIELTLVNRDPMGFRMLLGRQALRGRFLIDPRHSYLGGGRPKRKRRRRAEPPADSGPSDPDTKADAR